MKVPIEELIMYFGIVKAGKHIRYQYKRFRIVKTGKTSDISTNVLEL